jgi:hypothetical protein
MDLTGRRRAGARHVGGMTAGLASPRLALVLSLTMAKSIRDNIKKPRGRPVTTGRGTLIGVRLTVLQLAKLDAWIGGQNTPMTRPEAIRAMMETILHILSKDPGEKPAKKARIR